MGTVATNIVNTVSFYNSTGVIEREHNLYYVPHSSMSSGLTYLNLLIDKLSQQSNNELGNLTISQWSPEDRTLTISARIELFRRSTTINPLNYMILRQVVTPASGSDYTTYYAYFIKGVRQTGIGNVTLELEPDHFTNVFFLQRRTGVGDVFNVFIKNAYVERQHYDRTSYNNVYLKKLPLIFNETSDELGNVELVFHISKSSLGKDYEDIQVLINRVIVDGSEQTIATPTVEIEDAGDTYLFTIEFYCGLLGEYPVSVYLDIASTYRFKRFTNDNLFINYPEAFKYRRQFRDTRKRLYNSLTPSEEAELNNEWSQLSMTVKDKILKQCLCVVHCVLNTKDLILVDENANRDRFKYFNSGVKKDLIDIITFSYNIPDVYKKYEDEINKSFTYFYIKDKEGRLGELSLDQLQSKPEYTPYIASCYISKDDEILEHISFKNIQQGTETYYSPVIESVKVKAYSGESSNYVYDSLHLVGIPNKADITDTLAGNLHYEAVTGGGGAPYTFITKTVASGGGASGRNIKNFLYNPVNKLKWTLNLSDTKEVSKTEFFEPILLFEPYSFYSMSYLGYMEVPLNKVNFFQRPIFDLDIITEVSDTMKVSVIPTYFINDNYLKYYTESLVLTLNNQVTFSSEALQQYLIQNRAQMKNQFAVNDLNLSYDLGRTVVGGAQSFVDTSAMTGMPALGGIRATSETVFGTINNVINWSQSDRTIGMTQRAKQADLGQVPNSIKQAGTDIGTDLSLNELGIYLNHYKIDEMSYNNIAKYLERYGYLVNMYADLNAYNRKGWNYIKLIDFEFDKQLSPEQEESIRQIFKNGVTLLHEPSYLHSNTLHNYEVVLDS